MMATLNKTIGKARGTSVQWPPMWRYVGIAAILAIAGILPFAVSGYHLSQFSQVLIYAIAMLGLNILTGFNGQILLGHGAFYGIGAYTTAILLDKTGIPYWSTVPIAGAICLGAGFLFGLPALWLALFIEFTPQFRGPDIEGGARCHFRHVPDRVDVSHAEGGNGLLDFMGVRLRRAAVASGKTRRNRRINN
jgi:hypothetical protein